MYKYIFYNKLINIIIWVFENENFIIKIILVKWNKVYFFCFRYFFWFVYILKMKIIKWCYSIEIIYWFVFVSGIVYVIEIVFVIIYYCI